MDPVLARKMSRSLEPCHGCNELRELGRPWSRAIVDSGAFALPPG